MLHSHNYKIGNLASRRIRWIALVIDITILNCVLMSVPKIIPDVNIEQIYRSGIAPAIYLVYATYTEYKFQATLGKMICKIAIAGRSESKPTLKQAFLRNASKFIPFETLSCILGRDKSFHDVIGDTYVIKSLRA